MPKNPAPSVAAPVPPTTIPLDFPIVRGEQTISAVQLRKPASGELRGVALSDLLQMDVVALQTVLPRITSPTLTAHDVAQLDPADLVALAGGVVLFLLPKAAREAASLDA
ncbi:phage tail assembly protein [Lysobacter sp. Root604]|uniref:phage tail assembly protein n=1 Tax=Lysobacter sp. Root604 TaxID=1736568 RepID=UPI0006FDFEE6|nr:phage tail assembly protein [Lysobacter sp. Root604]KRA15362.1 phage tail protein [Lysobacter sp. Root604]